MHAVAAAGDRSFAERGACMREARCKAPCCKTRNRGVSAGRAAAKERPWRQRTARTLSGVAAHVKASQRQLGPVSRDGACNLLILSASHCAPHLHFLSPPDTAALCVCAGTLPVSWLLLNMRPPSLGQAEASSFGSVPFMELLLISKYVMLLKLAHAAIGSVPVRQHSLDVSANFWHDVLSACTLPVSCFDAGLYLGIVLQTRVYHPKKDQCG